MTLNIQKRMIFLLMMLLVVFCFFNFVVITKANNLFDDQSLKRVEIFLLPHSGSFSEGSSFEVPILINTNLANVYGINVRINFDQSKLEIIKPSGGGSIIGSWIEPPSYDNTKGTLNYSGTISGGIVTDSGLIATITFRAVASGPAVVSVDRSSQISLNDGIETKVALNFGTVKYDIFKKISEGVNIFSETNPSEDKWYNNNSPILSWQHEEGVTGFSFVLDNKPFTIK